MQEHYFSQRVPLPETDPIRTAAYLLERLRINHENQPILYSLMSDLLRLLSRQMPKPTDFSTLEMIEQNIHGLEQHIRRGRLGTIAGRDGTLRELGLARRFVRMACMDVRS